MWQLLIIAIIIFCIISIVPAIQCIIYLLNSKETIYYKFEQQLLDTHLRINSNICDKKYFGNKEFEQMKNIEYSIDLP